jgi:HD-GYP domain-containing protein (c-di-GMP phosphodiesterase class II)
MQLANQIFYLAIFVTLIGLMASFFWGKGSQKDQYRIIYWPLALALLAVSSFGLFVSPWIGISAIAFANITLMSGVACLTLLFSTWNHSLTRVKKFIILGLLLGSSVVFLYLIVNGAPISRIHLVNATLVVFSIWQINCLTGVLKKEKTYQVKLLIFVELFQLTSRILRSLLLVSNPDIYFVSLHDEDLLGFSLRIASALSNVLICILITNFYLDKLMEEHQKSAHAIENGMLDSLNALSMVRDNETGNHIQRTKKYVQLIANRLREMGVYKDELSISAVANMTKAAPLHDIGKVGIPDNILKKNGSLTDDEWTVMKTHALLGEEVLKAAKVEDAKHTKVLDAAIDIAGGHHECWDGSGYPRSLRGHDIPLAARIMSIADMYDALVSERVYKEKWSHQDACTEITRLKGVRFDPAVVEAFLLEQENFARIAELYGDE